MKVLQIVRQYRPCIGGLENFVYELATHLKQNGVTSDVLTIDEDFVSGEKLPAHSVEDGITVTRIPYKGSKRYPLATSVLQYVHDYDLIHVHAVDFFIDYLSLFKYRYKKPVVLSTHGGFFHTKKQQTLKKMYFNTITRATLKNVDAVVACSENDYETFRAIMPDHLHLIENGINFSEFSTISAKRCHKNNLMFVGRFSQNKRVDRLLLLMKRLKPDFPDLRLKIAGRDFDNLRGTYDRLSREYGIEDNVTIRESLSQEALLTELADSQYFISASEYEGFGLSALEAMAAGRIPFLSNIPSFQKMIDDGRNGFILDFEQIDEVQRTVTDVLRMPHKEGLIGNAIRTAERYSWSSVVKQFIALYDDVLRGRAVR
ncbi:glycosyltransferase family 4 protein [Numidum massiliense]|uniref:glycosyltransferase family 4 protein n=1 Tax=Numidum massiliense TaxID=1522315 RepID=UPI0006D52F44|nr:glycosyltransferase family 4 protein [Numidum massiliense]